MRLNSHRRSWFAVCALGALLFFAPLCWAGTYLSRAGLLVEGASADTEFLRARVNDVELARVVQRLAEARVQAAGSMDIPKEVALAHPHLLLVLENYERAAQAAVSKDPKAFVVLHARARDEEATLRGVLKQLGFELPKVRP